VLRATVRIKIRLTKIRIYKRVQLRSPLGENNKHD